MMLNCLWFVFIESFRFDGSTFFSSHSLSQCNTPAMVQFNVFIQCVLKITSVVWNVYWVGWFSGSTALYMRKGNQTKTQKTTCYNALKLNKNGYVDNVLIQSLTVSCCCCRRCFCSELANGTVNNFQALNLSIYIFFFFQ